MKLTDASRLSVVMLAGIFAACSHPAPEQIPFATPSATVSATPVVTKPIAKISEILSLPVFVRLLTASQAQGAKEGMPQEQAAKEGMNLQAGETIRTEGHALAQIDMLSGLAFRLAGNAVLTLQPNRLTLTSGDMITWIQPGKKLPTEIVTPVAVAGIRGTTVFVKIPQDLKDGVLFFAWEGSVAVRLTGQTEAVLLQTADEVRIKPGDRDIRQIRQRVRRMSRAEWRQKRQTDPLLRSFKKGKMSTLSIIDRLKPGQITLSTLPATPERVESNPEPTEKFKEEKFKEEKFKEEKFKEEKYRKEKFREKEKEKGEGEARRERREERKEERREERKQGHAKG